MKVSDEILMFTQDVMRLGIKLDCHSTLKVLVTPECYAELRREAGCLQPARSWENVPERLFGEPLEIDTSENAPAFSLSNGKVRLTPVKEEEDEP